MSISLFGISEVVSLDDKTLQAAKLTDEEFNQLTSDERVRHVIEQSEYYGYSGDRVRGLIFAVVLRSVKNYQESLMLWDTVQLLLVVLIMKKTAGSIRETGNG